MSSFWLGFFFFAGIILLLLWTVRAVMKDSRSYGRVEAETRQRQAELLERERNDRDIERIRRAADNIAPERMSDDPHNRD